MKAQRLITMSVALAVLAGGTALAQRGRGGFGRGEAWGFRGVGLGNWALHENGIDSIAARFQLTEEQRAQFEELGANFRSENADVLERWEQMRGEIEALYTEDQMPTRDAILRIGEKYNHPSRDMGPALDQLMVETAGLLTFDQRNSYRRWSDARLGRGSYRPSFRRRLDNRRFTGSPSQRGMRGYRYYRRRPPDQD